MVAPVARPFSYLWNYKTNLENLKEAAEKLEAEGEAVESRIGCGEEPLQNVKRWQYKVNKTVEEAWKLINEDNPEQANTQCCKGFSPPNLWKRYQHSKNAVGKLKDVDGLQREGEGFREFSRPTIAKQPWLQSSEDYDAFESRTSILKKIMDALLNPDVNKVGIYGMGGVGKTTLAKEVGRIADREKLFNNIVFVEVSESPDIKTIQGVIADNLNLRLTAETLSGRASELYEKLKEKKKEGRILLILDNIWPTVDFKDVVIPLEEDGKEIKLLLITRSCNVLTKFMVESQHQFCINVLNGEDAWSLFKSKASESIEKPDLKSIATEVVEVCGGIPLAIVVIAEALKNKGQEDWKNALRELKQPWKGTGGSVCFDEDLESFEGDLAKVYKSIELSYKFLRKKELQRIFLLCSRMGRTHNASIQNLFRYGFGLGYFEKVNTMEEALCKVYALVNELKATSLLLGAPNSQEFSVDDVVCHTARIMASRENVFTVIDDVIPRFLTNKNTLSKCTSLTLHNYGELPEDLPFVCPNLKFLYMKAKESFSRILDDFFAHMSSLQVLHLVEMDFRKLPASFSFLVNLQALCLDQCEMGDTTAIGNLKKLEILSFRGSDIEKLPEEMRHLTRLRLLDLTDCFKLSVIPPDVMSNLTKLEALFMVNTSIQWEVETPNIERSNANIDELKHLCNLTLLEIHILDAKMSKGLLSPKLERYKIIIGDKWKNWEHHSRTYRMLKLSLDTNEDGIISRLEGIEELELGEVPGATNLLDALDRNGFPTLKHLEVESSSHCSYIVESCDALPSLQSLILKCLDNMEKICNGPLGANTFLQLRTIRVDKCPKLNNIFSFSTVTVLLQLDEIKVSRCENMEEIFAIGGQDDSNNTEVVNEIKFSQLRIMDLRNLPRLKSFCCKVKPASAMQLTRDTQPREIISGDEIDVLTSLFNDKVAFPNLRTLDIYKIPVEKIWHNLPPKISSCVQNLTMLYVSGCGNLKELFSSSTVVTDESREEEMRDTILFPKLNYLEIYHLEKLTTLWSGYHIEFPALKEFKIQGCPQLDAFIFNDKVVIPNLEKLTIFGMDNLEKIWHNQLVNDSFCKLKSLKVDGCKKLLNVFPSNIYGRLLSLESLKVDACDSLEEIFDLRKLSIYDSQIMLCFANLQKLGVSRCPSLKNLFYASILAKEGVVMEEAPARFLFPKLTSVKLFDLPELRSFYPGRHKVEGPVLKKLQLFNCGIHDTDEEGQMQEPSFFSLVEEAFPCLEELKLAGKNVTMLWQGQVPKSLFDTLKILEVWYNESTVLPFGIIQRCQNLEELSLNFSSYKEIFPHGEDQTRTKIKTLNLFYLKDLKYIWKKNSKLDLIIENLEVLRVQRCDSLINLMPPPTSFQNLTSLEVMSCNSLIHMGTSSVAKSLVQLTEMSISSCEKITEVIGNHGDVIEDEIIFRKLKSLLLQDLPSLTSFCSWNFTLKFPSLENLFVQQCWNMKIFSRGDLTVQKLQIVTIDWKTVVLRSDFNLNIAIQQSYENANEDNNASSSDHSE